MEDIHAKLLNYAFRILAGRDYSEAEMRQKLLKKVNVLLQRSAVPKPASLASTADESVVKAQARLKELGYLDDEKFAKRFIESRAATSPRGKYLFRMELKQKGISGELFEKFWDAGGYSEGVLAAKLLEHKKRQFFRLSGEKRKKKIFSILSSRGFSGEVIYACLE